MNRTEKEWDDLASDRDAWEMTATEGIEINSELRVEARVLRAIVKWTQKRTVSWSTRAAVVRIFEEFKLEISDFEENGEPIGQKAAEA